MLSAVFDASGSKTGQPILLVAGFVSSVDQWVEFDKEWKQRLAEDQLPYFHAQKFAQSSGPFSHGWQGNEKRRIALSGDLVSIIQRNAHRKFATVVVNELHQMGLSEDVRRSFHLEVYPLAGRNIAHKVVRYAQSFSARHSPEFIFEDGDLDKGLLMKRFAKDGYPDPIFRPKKDTTDKKTGLMKPGYTPLQAADLLAYEVFLAYKKNAQDVPYDDFRWPYKELDKMPEEVGIFTVKDIQRTNDMLERKRSGSRVIRDPETGAWLLPRLK